MTGLTIIAALALAGLEPGVESGQGAPGGAQGAADSPLSVRVQAGYVLATGINHDGVAAEAEEAFHLHAALDLALVYRLRDGVAVEVATGLVHIEDQAKAVGMTYPIDSATVTLTQVPVTLGVRAGVGDPGGRSWFGVTAGAGVYLSMLEESFHSDDSSVSLDTGREGADALGGYVGFAFAGAVGERTQLGVEVRYVKTTTSFDHVDLSSDGMQILAGLSYRFGPAGTPR